MSEIRLVFAGLPLMLSEIIRNATEATTDMRVVDERRTLVELAEAARAAHPDVMVVGSRDGGLPSECIPLMYQRTHPGTLSISEDGTLTTSFRLVPHGVAMANVSPDQIVQAIRELTRSAPAIQL